MIPRLWLRLLLFLHLCVALVAVATNLLATSAYDEQCVVNPLNSVSTTSTTANFASYMAASTIGGLGDMLRVGQGTADATYNARDGYDVAIGITQDIARAAGIATIVGGGIEGAVRDMKSTVNPGATVASSGGGDILPATVVRQIQQGEKVSNLIDEVAQLTYETGGQEHAIVSLQSGDRVIVSGGTGGIDFTGMSDLNRIILHTHPTTTGPSALDFQMLQQTGQQSSWIYELFGGGLTKMHK